MPETESDQTEISNSEIEPKSKPIQKIIFGSPGTGKSYQVRDIAVKSLGIKWENPSLTPENVIKTVFHPEYTYSDFVGKLLPQTTGSGSVIYKYYAGHFIRALGLAYRQIIDGNQENILLVIDELNRGNASAIFGSVFQLLDREEDDWSSYEVDLSELEIVGLWRSMKYDAQTNYPTTQVDGSNINKFYEITENELKNKNNKNGLRVLSNLKNNKIAIPFNLSIIGTINTSDESIYYLDSAFKRRWDWEYVDVPSSQSAEIPEIIKEIKLVLGDTENSWSDFVINLNDFIKFNHQSIRRIEDKQIGWWFLKPKNKKIEEEAIKNKLMFYLWDSVFSKDRRPLAELLTKACSRQVELITYSDFVALSTDFVSGIIGTKWKP
jgi:5-methylcytosine-specific restriction protein B